MSREEEVRQWLSNFIKAEWGRCTQRELNRLRSMCRRCMQMAQQEDCVREACGVGKGRGQQGFRCSRVLYHHRKRLCGGGRRPKCAELGFELYQWLVDTIQNLKCRVKGWMLTQQALLIKEDIERFAEENGVDVDLPQIEGTGWMTRWAKEWGICVRSVTLVYKVSWADLLTRVGIGCGTTSG